MVLSEMVYEFINGFAYFACAANIIMENYTVTDNEEAYKRIMWTFNKYIDYYNKVDLAFSRGIITEDAARVLLKTYIAWLRNECITKFVIKIRECVTEEFEGKDIGEEIKVRLDNLQEKMKESDFSTFDLLNLVQDIRSAEETLLR